jgi:hypothetical protein
MCELYEITHTLVKNSFSNNRAVKGKTDYLITDKADLDRKNKKKT